MPSQTNISHGRFRSERITPGRFRIVESKDWFYLVDTERRNVTVRRLRKPNWHYDRVVAFRQGYVEGMRYKG